MFTFCVSYFFLFVCHLSASFEDGSPIITNAPGTKFTAKDLIESVISLFDNPDVYDVKYFFPFLVEYNETFKPSTSDPTERCDALKAAARKGNLYARVLYAGCFEDGFGRPKNIRKALKHYQLAADRGSPEAPVSIFFILYNDAITDYGEKRAINYLDLAAKHGDGYGQWLRGVLHFEDDEPRAAVPLFKKAANQGNILGELFYGICLLFGYGTAGNKRKGVEYLARVKKEEWAFPVFVAGLALHSANLHPKTATSCFRFGAKKDIHVAQAYYAWALEKGIGVKQNRKRAAEFYKKAVDAGYGPARDGFRRCGRSKVSK
jgi:TPR repeat protein